MTYVKILKMGEWKLASATAYPADVAQAIANGLRKAGLKVKLCLA